MSVRADWEFAEAKEIFLHRWVSPITVSALLLALTTALLWLYDPPLQHDHLIFIYFVPTALIAIRYGSLSAMGVTIASTFAAAYFFYRAALQLHGGQPARRAGAGFLQPAGAAGEQGGVRLCQ